jgi:GT2 family glycosyltransferase
MYSDVPFRIGILSYNHPELTQRVIESCLKLVSADQITLLHNGSESRWCEQLQGRFPAIEHLRLQDNQGFTGGANVLLARVFAQTPWCLFLTNDVQLLKLQVPKQKGLVAPCIYRRKHGVMDSLGGHFDARTGVLSHCRSEADFQAPPMGVRPYVPGTAFWLDRDTFATTGLFDTRFGTYWEDVDYSQRVQANGFSLVTDLETELIHSVGKTCHKKRFYTSYLFQRNKYYVTLKYSPSVYRRWRFRLSYWYRWLVDLTVSGWRRDREGVLWRFRILQDVLKTF